MTNFIEYLEKFLKERRFQGRITEEQSRQYPIDQIELEKEWFNAVELLEQSAREVIFPPLEAIGQRINRSPTMTTPNRKPDINNTFVASYRRAPEGIGRYLSSASLGYKRGGWLPHVNVELEIMGGSSSGSDLGWNTKDYTPGSGILVVCFQRNNGMFAKVSGYLYNSNFSHWEINMSNRVGIERAILAMFKRVY